MDELVKKYIEKAKSEGTFFGGKNGYDIISFDYNCRITGSGGNLDYRLRIAEKNNEAVAILIPVRFIQGD